MSNKRFPLFLLSSIMIGALFIYFLVQYSMSFGVYDDGYGTEIYSDNDWLVLTMASLIMLVYAIYATVKIYHFKPINQNGLLVVALIVSSLASLYPLGVFTKAMVKGKDFAPNQWYLYIGILGLILLGLSVAASIISYKRYKLLNNK